MIESNSYTSPESDLSGLDNVDRELISKVASRQRALCLLVLSQLLLAPLAKILEGLGDVTNDFIGMLSIALLIWVAVTAVRLSLLLNHVAVTIFLGVFSVIPLLNLIVLLILSRQSTRLLRSSGIRVGLLGASSKDIGNI